MKIDEIDRDELKQLMKEAIAEVLSEMSVDSDGKIKPEIEQQLLAIRKRRQQEDSAGRTLRERTISADELKRSLSSATSIRSHDAFLNGYNSKDEGLYDDR